MEGVGGRFHTAMPFPPLQPGQKIIGNTVESPSSLVTVVQVLVVISPGTACVDAPTGMSVIVDDVAGTSDSLAVVVERTLELDVEEGPVVEAESPGVKTVDSVDEADDVTENDVAEMVESRSVVLDEAIVAFALLSDPWAVSDDATNVDLSLMTRVSRLVVALDGSGTAVVAFVSVDIVSLELDV
jgi:hypothetical protein